MARIFCLIIGDSSNTLLGLYRRDFVGVLIGCITFAYGASQTNAIKFCFDGAEYRSSLDRSCDELAIIADNREEVQGFILQSYLFLEHQISFMKI